MATKLKLKMLKPRLALAPTPMEARGIKMAPRVRQAKATGRDADPRRTIPLNSAAWQRLRAHVLAGEPLCRECSKRGLVEPATDVDHHDGDPSNNDMDNLVGLCHSCHSRKTARDHGARIGHGCDASGMPMDPDHPWNRC